MPYLLFSLKAYSENMYITISLVPASIVEHILLRIDFYYDVIERKSHYLYSLRNIQLKH